MPKTPRPPITHHNHRFYDRPRGEWRHSTTKIADAATDSKALLPWAARETAARAVHQHDTVTSMLAEGRDRDAVNWLAKAPTDARDLAGQIGTTVHSAAESFIRTEEIPDGLQPEVERAVVHLVDYLDHTGIRLTQPELCVYNSTLGYGGTLDALAHLPDSGPNDPPVVVDFKTGRSGPYASWALQVASYAHCDTHVMDDANQPLPPMDTRRALILRLRPDGCTPLVVDLPPAWDAFQGALRVWLTTRNAREELFTAYDAPTADRVMDAIAHAPSTDALRRLYRHHYPVGQWTAVHTEAANQRINSLMGAAV